MQEPILRHMGSRIRLYRKTNSMTMDELARKVHKSKASISKYEAGLTAVDVITLLDISLALGVTPAQLIDYEFPSDNLTPSSGYNIFDQAPKLYLYYLTRKTIRLSLIQLESGNQNGLAATMFYGVDDLDRLDKCSCVYRGHMHSYSTVLNYVFRNHHNPAETILLNFCVPMYKTTILTGMISGLGMSSMMPIARKVVLSTEPLSTGTRLREMLTISLQSCKEIKTKNMLEIPCIVVD